MTEEMTITITPLGVEIDAKGYKGKACIESLDAILAELEAMGIHVKVVERRMKGEYYVRAGSDATVKTRYD